jgi:PAS domain S-box-containing protein
MLLGAGVVLATALALLFIPGLASALFSPGFFMPHSHCYLDNPRMIWLQGMSDFLVGASYMAISAALAYLVWKARKDIPFGWMFLAFGLFIFSCGWTHFMEVWTLWHPIYWLSGAIKAVTAVASVATAAGCFLLMPHVFGLIETAKASEQRRRDLAIAHGELQQAYQRLEGEEARARLAAIVQHSEDAIISMNLAGGVTSWNAAAEQLLGYGAEEMIGRSFTGILPPEEQQQEPGILEKVGRGEAISHYETVRVAKDGRRIEVSLTVSPLRDPEGRIIGVSKVMRDITERKRSQQALRESEQRYRQLAVALAEARDKLEQTVAERTAQLVEANNNLQDFAHTAAHDLRAPLRSINNYSSLVVEEYGGQLGPEGQLFLERVVESAKQMDGLLNDLLEYSRMSQAELKLEPVNLRQAVSEALALVDAEIRSKAAAVIVTEPLPDVMGHMATVVLLINNLVSNALKFVAPGVQPHIGISAERSGDGVRVSVQDNGIGIAPEHLEKIFGAFERLHGKQAYPGTGLGLAIVRKGAERIGGRAGVESEIGTGSRFWVELQAAQIPA